MADYDEVDSNNDLEAAGGTEDHTNLDMLSTHHADAKYSNTREGNNMIRTAGNMRTIGAARAKYSQNDTKAP